MPPIAAGPNRITLVSTPAPRTHRSLGAIALTSVLTGIRLDQAYMAVQRVERERPVIGITSRAFATEFAAIPAETGSNPAALHAMFSMNPGGVALASPDNRLMDERHLGLLGNARELAGLPWA